MAVAERTTLDGSEAARRGNRDAVLRSPQETARRFADHPEAVAETVRLADRLRFDLTRDLGYRFPDFVAGHPGETAQAALTRVCVHQLGARYPNAARRVEARARLDEELALIEHHGLAGFFLLHRDLLEMAREVALRVRPAGSARRGLPPGRGRGSSVGSIVCYLTGLSHIDPVANRLFLGRFLNRDMASVPDIDLDFPRDIRETLIKEVIERYGSEHAALVAAFPTFRARMAIRELGAALALPEADLERLARMSDGWTSAGELAEQLKVAARRRGAAGLLAALAGARLPGPRGRRPAAPPLPALGRHGGQRAPAGGAGAGGAGRLPRPPDLPVGQGLLRRRRLREDRRARPGDALGGRGVRRPDRPLARRARRPVADRLHRPGGLRRDPGRRHGGRLPDREPGPDAEPAPDPAREPRGPDRAGRPDPARAGQRRRGAPLRQAPARQARGPGLRAALRPPAAGRRAARHARRGGLPGAGARGGDGARRLHPRPGRGPAPRHEPQAQPRRHDRPLARVPRRRPRARGRRPDHPHGLHQADRLLELRLPQGPLGGLRGARLPERLAAPALPGRVPLRPAERPADGLLPAGQPGPRRPAARRAGAARPASAAPGPSARSRTAPSGSAWATCARCATRPPAAWWPSAMRTAPSATWPTSPPAPTCAASSSPSSCAPARPTSSSGRAGRCSGSSASWPAREPAPRAASSRCRCRRPPPRRCPSPAGWSGP